ncbi:MAG: hypothetical protein JRI74_03600 [Deltaproteobacteria bacterium]|nr:hypothetical protein [Deltaproteobacteria bacterium]
MKIQYLFSSPDGDITLTTEDLARPFLITPTTSHPFLTLGNYFGSIEAFLLKDPAKPLHSILKERFNKQTDINRIQKILIRSEKHGALYHPASIEVMVEGKQLKIAVSTAVSEKGKLWLTREYEILKHLNRSYKLPYLPNIYTKGEVECKAVDQKNETLVMILAEWFEGYHEWHLSIDETDRSRKICIWDLENGNRYASEQETFEIFRQASKILTFYYDTNSFNQIYPWHHAAGDFIVGTRNGSIDVKLTTARRYESIMGSFSEDTVNPIIAIVYFFLNLTVRMQLDKLDGIGKTVWAGDFSAGAATAGFFEALMTLETEDRYNLGKVEDLLSLLQSFSEEELEGLFQSLLILYQKDDPEDLAVIQENLGGHINLLYQTLRDFRLNLS